MKRPNYREMFLSAKVGDVLQFEQFEGEPHKNFVGRMQNQRSYYKKYYGMQTLMNLEGREARITVREAATAAVTTVYAAPGVDPDKKPKAVKPAPVAAAPEPEPEPEYSDDARAFFREVFTSAMRFLPGASPELCAQEAKRAARAFSERF